ncbi:host-nuclease inhibitor protein Gam, partial [Salmonella enterica]|nr:host-nuclease inhibitor protein Gam [Salmonella enterica]
WLHMLESLCMDELPRHGANKKAISRAFDDDVEFQERASEFVRYMAETFSRHQIDIESEE